MERVWTIYGLTDPMTGAVRYVGVTCQPLAARFQKHCSPSEARRESHTHKGRWIASLKAAGLLPGCVTLETCGPNWPDREKFWIAATPDLTNSTDGGDGTVGRRQSEEAKARVGNANRGRKHSEEELARMRAAHRKPGRLYPKRPHKVGLSGVPHTEETKALLRARVFTAETRAKMSAAAKARIRKPHSEETKARMRHPHRRRNE